jgi:hypothetical protein
MKIVVVNSEYVFTKLISHKYLRIIRELVGLYNRDMACFLQGINSVFIHRLVVIQA